MEVTQETVDKLIDEIKAINARGIQEMLAGSKRELNLVKDHYESKLAELRGQNDGLLGAVGSLTAERDALQKKFQDNQVREKERDMHFHQESVALHHAMEEERIERRNEIEGYKKQISELQAKLKKSGAK